MYKSIFHDEILHNFNLSNLNHVQSMSFRNDEFSIEYWKFVLIFFQLTLKSDLKEVQFAQNYLFWVKAPL